MDPVYRIEVLFDGKDKNICIIHERILGNFEYYTLSSLREEISQIKYSSSDRKEEYLKKILKGFERGGKEKYLEEANTLIEKYLSMSKERFQKTLDVFSLGKKKKEVENNPEKIEVILKYLDVAAKYVCLDVINSVQEGPFCPGCGDSYKDVEDIGGMYTCKCGYQIPSLSSNPSSGVGSRSNYENRKNFQKGMDRKQGKPFTKIPEGLYDKLDAYFSQTGSCKPRNEILHQPLNKDGEKDGTSLQLLRHALSAIGYSSLYNEIDFILHEYWGWELLNFSHLEEEMMKFYDDTQEVYDSIEDKTREASLNLNVRMYLQLRGLGFKVKKDRFFFQENEKSLEFHQEMWQIMCEKSGRPFVPLI